MSETLWYYQHETQSIGPFAEDQLASLFAAQTLTRDTPVRTLSNGTWRPMSEVFAFARASPPRLPSNDSNASAVDARIVPSSQDQESAVDSQSSGEWKDTSPHPWRRYFARMFDANLLGILSWALIGFVFYSADPIAADSFFESLDSRVGRIAGILLTVPLSMIWTGMFLGLTGSTPGKWLFGIRILDADGAPPGLFKAYEREAMVWILGLGCAIPFVSMVTMLIAYTRLDKLSNAQWDQKLSLVATHRPEGGAQVALGAVGIVLWLAISISTRFLS